MGKIRLGFIGAGYMGQIAHLQNYAQLSDECEIKAIADPKYEQAAAVAKIYGAETVYSDYREMLEKEDIDAVVAAQPCITNVNIVPVVLESGRHILTEAPITLFAHNADELAALAKEKKLIYMIGYNRRSDPAVEFALEHIKTAKADGKWGRLKYVRITMPPGDMQSGSKQAYITGEPYPSMEWEPRPDAMPEEFFDVYNSVINGYIHQVNLLRFLISEDYRVTFADASGILLCAESDSGITGVIEMDPYATSDDWQEKALVCFERAYVEISLPAPLASQQAGTVKIFSDVLDGGVTKIYRLPNIHSMKNQALNFLKAIRGEIALKSAPDDAIRDLEVAAEYAALFLKN